ncbi:MAG TPA: hypothetical protein PKD61_39325 [Polyangiaceae bacterium]|nr:hypothetical protein [Polyangiaceae bacterium]
MPQQSESDLLSARLEAIRAEKLSLQRRLDELDATEQRISYALDVFRSVVADAQRAGSANVTVGLAGVSMNAVGGSGALDAVSASGEGVAGPRPKQRLEDLILEAFGESGGLTSVEIAAAVDKVSDAKRESVLSTVSRMASKKLLRREGKLYFLVQKGDSPEAATSGLSGATTSGEGQPTSRGSADEEGDDDL